VTPPPAAAPRAASVRSGRERNARSAVKRPALRVLEPRPRRRGRWTRALAAGLVAGSLLAVVVAHSLLAEDEVRLTAAQQQVATEQAVHRQLLASVAAAENPARIIAEAARLNLVTPSSVTQLPSVSLTVPIASSTAADAPSTGTSGQ
jgi:predicted alpha/beta hydrolase family esterase